jgi:hypothetical protein
MTPRTTGTDEAIVDYLIDKHRAAIQAASQDPVDFIVETWRNWLSDTVDEDVFTLLEMLGGNVLRGDTRPGALPRSRVSAKPSSPSGSTSAA